MLKNLSPVTLRDTMVLKPSTIFSFHKILLHTDLPYEFDQVNKYWWRWYSEIYGFFYHRIKRTYSIWLTMSLKKNIGVYMSFFMRIPSKRSKILDRWKRRSFLYKNTLINKNFYIKNPIFYLSFEFPRKNFLSEISKDILLPGNRSKRSVSTFGVFGNELDMFFSTYNYKWNNLYKGSSMFYKASRMPKNFMIIVNNFFVNSGFFINSFDSSLMLYPQYFIEYHNKLYSKSSMDIILFFNLKNNIIFYKNLLLFLIKIYLNFIKFKYINYVNLFINKSDISFIIYKLNYYKFFLYLNYYKFYNNLNIYNKWFLYSLYLNKYNIYNFFFFNNYKILNNYNLLYFSFFSTFKKNYKKWILNKNIKTTYKWKYDYFFKLLNSFSLFNQTYFKNIGNFLYFKKFYIFEINYFWDIFSLGSNFKNKTYLNLKKKKQTNYFINKYQKFINKQYLNIKNCFDFLSFLSNFRNKYYIKNFTTFNSFFLIKPSLKINKVPLFGLVRWLTKFGKFFVYSPDLLKVKYNFKFINFFKIDAKIINIMMYFSYNKNFIVKFTNIISKFFNVMLTNFKINFGLSYNIITFFRKKKDISNLDNYFFFNIQLFVSNFLIFIKGILGKVLYSKNFKDFFFLKKLNIYDKIFFSYIFVFTKKKLKFVNSIWNNNTYIYKGLKLSKLKYFINNNKEKLL